MDYGKLRRLLATSGCISIASCPLQDERPAGAQAENGEWRVLSTFTDVTLASGLTAHADGIWPGHGSWAGAWADVDQDGDPDLYTIGHIQPSLCGGNQFWRNNGDGTFTESTRSFGLDDRDGADLEDSDCDNGSTVEDGSPSAFPRGTNSCADGRDNGHRIDTHGVVWADFDRDRAPELFLSSEPLGGRPWLNNGMWRNDGGSFVDITHAAGVAGRDQLSRSTAAADYDRDGWLDLFIVTWPGAPGASPNNVLYRNEGNLTFTDVAVAAGVAGPSGQACDLPNQPDETCPSGTCLADRTCAVERRSAEWLDYDDDGWPDLFISPPCGLLRNNRNGTFTDVTESAGISRHDECQSAAIADYDNDGHLDLFSARGFRTPTPNVLYRNNGNGTFTDVTLAIGVNAPQLTRAASFGDYDNDGDDDLYVVNFNKPSVANHLYENNGDGTFTDVAVAAGAAALVQGFGCSADPAELTEDPNYCAEWEPPASLGTAGGSDGTWVDYDVDGDLDIFMTNGEGTCRGPFVLLSNNGVPEHHWLKLDLVGTISNLDGLMSRVTVETGGRDQHYLYTGQHHFMAQNKLPLHVGLGTQTTAERIVVRWPNGLEEAFHDLAGDRVQQLIEGTGEPLEGSAESDGDSAASAETTAPGTDETGDSDGGPVTGTFVEVAQEVGLDGLNASWGVAWTDFDNDGHIDVFAYSHLPEITCSRTRLFRNNGDDTFSDVSLEANFASDPGEDTAPAGHPDVCVVDPDVPPGQRTCNPCEGMRGLSAEQIDAHDQGDTHGAVWLDFDRDGCKDLYVINGSNKMDPSNPGRTQLQYNRLWRNNCDGTFTNVADSSDDLRGINHRGRGAFAFDIDVDGWTDLFATCFDRSVSDLGNLLLRNNGDATFVDIAPAAGVARDDGDNRSGAWADYDNDGDIDLIVSGSPGTPESPTGGACALWRNDGNETFTNVTVAAGIVEDVHCVGFAFADFNNDGRLDLYLTRGFDTARNDILYRNRGDGTFEDVSSAAGILPSMSATRGVTAGDYDNDGFIDFYVVRLTHGGRGRPDDINRLYRNLGDGTFEDVASQEEVEGRSFAFGTPPVENLVSGGMMAAFVDYNQDGQLDITVTNGEGQTELAPYFLYRNEGRTGHWLEVDLQGVQSEIHGLGARLMVEGSRGVRYRYQSGPHHLLSQSLVPVHFGLGRDTQVTLTVTWPSGTVDTIENLSADQIVTVREGEGLIDGTIGDDTGTTGGETSISGGDASSSTDDEGTTGRGPGPIVPDDAGQDESASPNGETTSPDGETTARPTASSGDENTGEGNVSDPTESTSSATSTSSGLVTGSGGTTFGFVETETDTPSMSSSDDGCSCDARGKPVDPVLGLLVLGGIGYRRRRKRAATVPRATLGSAAE